MSFSGIEQIRGCESVQELQNLWQVNSEAWSQLPDTEAKELIRVKDICKAGLLFQFDVDTVVQELNRLWDQSGCEIEDIPQERRDRALNLDALMTQKANGGDVESARVALEQWRACWMPKEEATGGLSALHGVSA